MDLVAELCPLVTAQWLSGLQVSELAKTLTLDYNKARQAAITQEILEVVGGSVSVG